MKNDRFDHQQAQPEAQPKPLIEIIADGNKILKPSMKTFFVRIDEEGTRTGEVHSGGTVCAGVCSCDTVCGCLSAAGMKDNLCSSCECFAAIRMDQVRCSCIVFCPCAPVH